MPATTSTRSTLALAALLAISASACSSDHIVAPSSQAAPTTPQENIFTAHAAFQRYVAIGTSISAGVQSDGLTAGTQLTSWPAQLAAMSLSALKQPYIGGTGCHAPIIAPLLLNVRLSGESASADPATLSCGPLLPGVTTPFDNVALNGAFTASALDTTPQNIGDLGDAKIYARVLQPNMTQVTTMMARNPTLVSVELGSNEILGAISSGHITPFGDWLTAYDKVLDSVQKAVGKTTKMAVVVGLIDHLANVQAFRAGDDLWQDRAEFALFNITLSNCQGSQNQVFVPFAIPPAIAAGLLQAQHGAGPFTFDCNSPAFILTPFEVGIVDAQMQAMSGQIALEATTRGFAYFPLGALYDVKNAKGSFSLVRALTSGQPFGPYFSLDGVHPNAAGQAVLARAAAQALNAKYPTLGIPIF